MGELAICNSVSCTKEMLVDPDDPRTVSVTYTLVPPVIGYYHAGCYDPWADEVGHGVSETPAPVTNPLAEKLTELFDEIGAMMEERHAKYGPGNIAEFGDIGILVRMADKFARLKNGQKNFSDETVHSTLDDIIGYGLIWKMWLNGDWPGSNS